jgi:drug/metabolite transporter (DMT)-like permease
VILLFRRQKDEGPYGSVFLGNVLTVLVCLPFMMKGVPDIQGGLGLALLGTVQMGAAFSLYSIASRYVTALTASIVLLLEAVLNPVWTFLAIGEVPGTWAMVGGAIILAAITFQAVVSRQSGKAFNAE